MPGDGEFCSDGVPDWAGGGILIGKLSVKRFECRAAALGRGGSEARWSIRCCSNVGGEDILLEDSPDVVAP
jgi:hypothetical protein